MSATHSLLQRITTAISARVGSSSGTYTLSNYQYQYAVGGVPLLSAATDGPGYGISSRPDVESAIEQRKDQFDNYKDPGEYSLNQWWLRSQTSFIGGAGVVYQDPDTQGQALNVRFAQSIGVDPFTDPDNIQLLREVNTSAVWTPSALSLGTPALLAPAPHLTNNSVWIAQSNIIKLMDIGTSDVSNYGTATIVVGSLPSADSMDSFITSSGTRFAVVAVTDGANPAFIYRINESLGVMTPISMYNAGLLPGSPVIRKARGVPFLGAGNNLYQLDPNSTGSAALPTPVAAIAQDQNIVSITDGPDAVYVAANDDTSGYIYKSTFNSTTGAVNGLSLIAVLPNGEMINTIASYVATYMIITTITGIRVAQFTGSGIVYGPPLLTVPVTPILSGFRDVAFFGTNAYVTVGDTSQHGGPAGVMCVNLASVISDNNTGVQNNAYCTWVYNPSATTPAVSIMTDQTGRILYTNNFSTNARLNVEHATNKISSGFLDTGRCRYNTLEPKLFKFMSIKTPTPLQGEVTVATLDEGGGVTNYITYGPSLTPGTADIATPTPAGPQNWLALRFTLRRNPSVLSQGGKLDAWQFKAIPGTIKQRSIIKNFLMFNGEKDQGGNNIFNPAIDRLDQIRQMCQRGDTVVFQDLVNNISTQVVIDNYEFTMLAPPGPNAENYGGYLRLTMRTVADVIPPLPPNSGAVDE